MHKQKFELVSPFPPRGDQIKAIDQIYNNFNNNIKQQVLLGATGTGKTFSVANIIQKLNKTTLVMAHNKTLAGQLYQELKALFPNNHVEYFVSYFDFYQPEAYVPTTDTYIEKSSQANKEIEMMRLSTLNSLSQYDDVIVVASVAAIYASVSHHEFDKFKINLNVNQTISQKKLRENLVQLTYNYNNVDLKPGTFRFKGDVLDIAFGYEDDYFYRISFFGDEIEKITKVDYLTGNVIEKLDSVTIYPASEYVLNFDYTQQAYENILKEMNEQVIHFKNQDRLIEAQRIQERTKRDIEAMKEFGFCSGIENYARHLEFRQPGQTPYTLFDFFNIKKDGWLLVIDESHMTIPQVRGMFNTDKSRKQTLVEYGFRLPSALDNRPLNFDEFNEKIDNVLYVSATPNEYEIEKSNHTVIEQIVRPTGLLDPTIEIKETKNQVDSLINELYKQRQTNAKTFISVMTIRMAEELTDLLKSRNIQVAYLHNELKTLQRSKILNDLRRSKYEAVVGINLLKEGIDVPEVSLVCIFDADKPGFFRSSKALIQLIGRAARNENGHIIMYADNITKDMQLAIDETNRRRQIQIEYNQLHNIVPKSIIKPIMDDIDEELKPKNKKIDGETSIKKLKLMMQKAAKNQEYELAAEIRDKIIALSVNKDNEK